MKVALAILLVVAVAGYVECMPKLKESVQARLANLQTKRGEGEDWPYAWIEYVQLVGKCESARNMLDAFNITLSEEEEDYCILAQACPKAIRVGEAIMKAPEEDQKDIAKFIKAIFPLLQCVNLEAVKESVMFALYMNESPIEGNVYLEEGAELFGLCQKVFDKVDEEAEEFEKDLEKIEEMAGDDEKRSLQAELQRLLKIAARKFK